MLDFELDRASLRLLLRLMRASMNAAVAASSTSSLAFNQNSFEFCSSSLLQSKGSNLLENENLGRQRVNGKRERRKHKTWWRGRSTITGRTLRRAWRVLWGVGTGKRRVWHFILFFCVWRLRFLEEKSERYKRNEGWRRNIPYLNLQLQLSEETWHLWGVMFVYQNARNEEAPKWLGTPFWATCPFWTSQGMIIGVLMHEPMWLSKAFAIKRYWQSGD